MRRRTTVVAVALLAMLLTSSGELGGEMISSGEGTLRLLCGDAQGSRIPKRLRITQTIVNQEIGDRDGGVLTVKFIPQVGQTGGRGRIKATARLLGEDGRKQMMGTLSGRQDTTYGEVVLEAETTRPPVNGDLVQWDLKLKKLPTLDAGECVILYVGVTDLPDPACGPYPEWSTSEYVLPYRAGQSAVISQGNCSVSSPHRGVFRHAYDFALPVGSEVLAARGGEVLEAGDENPEGTGLPEHCNGIFIRHDDGSLALYTHLAQGGVRVQEGQRVEQGETIALAGNSGNTGGLPHLHFQVTPCNSAGECGTSPISFRNTSPNPKGLQVGSSYRARGN